MEASSVQLGVREAKAVKEMKVAMAITGMRPVEYVHQESILVTW
jgi:hypothetical protein